MSINTPPAGIPSLEIDQKALEAALGGKPLPPPEIRISRPVLEGEEIPINTMSPSEATPPPRLRPEPAPMPENPLAKMSGTFAPVEVISAEATAALPEARQLLANIVTAVHAAGMYFPRLKSILAPHAIQLKTIHGFDLTEATEFIERAEKLLSPPEPKAAKSNPSKEIKRR